MESMHSLFFFIVAIAILVTFHEFGHYWVARKVGVKVLCFSIGFGKKLWTWQKSAESTEFVIAALPLGGYVKMVDEREAEVAAKDLPFAFNRQSLAARAAIVAAGPIFNLLLAFALFWLVLVIGEMGLKPLVAAVPANTLAAEAGFAEHDEILSINEKPTPTWTEALDTLYSLALSGEQQFAVVVKTLEGSEKTLSLTISSQDIENPETLQQHLGLSPWLPVIKPVIGKLVDQGTAKQAGLETGDLIISADGTDIKDWPQWVEYVQARPETEIHLVVERGDIQVKLNLIPAKEEQEGKTIGKIGAGVDIPAELMASYKVKHALTPWDAIPVAAEKTAFYSFSTLKMIGKMFVGTASVKNLSGPISIAQYAGQSADMGFTAFLKFLGLISVSLGVLNLLPIPVLDGGHLLFFALEAIKGSPISEKIQLYFQQFGMLLLLTLMMFAMYLDLGKLFQP